MIIYLYLLCIKRWFQIVIGKALVATISILDGAAGVVYTHDQKKTYSSLIYCLLDCDLQKDSIIVQVDCLPPFASYQTTISSENNMFFLPIPFPAFCP